MTCQALLHGIAIVDAMACCGRCTVNENTTERDHHCRACLEYLRVTNRNPDIIHVHEWQLSAVPMLYWSAGPALRCISCTACAGAPYPRPHATMLSRCIVMVNTTFEQPLALHTGTASTRPA